MADSLVDGALPARTDVRRASLVLAAVAGWTDGVGFLLLFGLFTAHMSGNSTRLGVSMGDGDWSDVITRLFPIPLFVVGITIGALALEAIHRRRERSGVALMLGVEAALLLVFLGLGEVFTNDRTLEPNSAAFFLLASLATVAMGLQTATLRRVGHTSVHTTFISGMLTQFSALSVRLFLDWRGLTAPDETVDRRETARRIALVGLIWVCYVIGASLGALAHTELGFIALVGPVAALVGVAIYDLRHDLAAP